MSGSLLRNRRCHFQSISLSARCTKNARNRTKNRTIFVRPADEIFWQHTNERATSTLDWAATEKVLCRKHTQERHSRRRPVWPDGCIFVSTCGHLEQGNFAQKYQIFAKVGSQFYQILNSYSRNGPKTYKILPNWQNFAKSVHTAATTKLKACFDGRTRWGKSRRRSNVVKHAPRARAGPWGRETMLRAWQERGPRGGAGRGACWIKIRALR